MVFRRRRQRSVPALPTVISYDDDTSSSKYQKRNLSSRKIRLLRLLILLLCCAFLFYYLQHKSNPIQYFLLNIFVDFGILVWGTLERWNWIDNPKPFSDFSSHYPYLMSLAQHYEVIQQEARNLYQQYDLYSVGDLVGANDKNNHHHSNRLYPDEWKTFPLQAMGVFIPGNEQLCPQTAELLHGIQYYIFTAILIILEPNTHVNPHWGYWKGFQRYQLPVIVPNNNASYLRVSEIEAVRHMNLVNRSLLLDTAPTHYYTEGVPIMFDDTRLHDVWNRSPDQIRVVLYLDVYRKLPWILDHINRACLLCLKSIAQMSASYQQRLAVKKRQDGALKSF